MNQPLDHRPQRPLQVQDILARVFLQEDVGAYFALLGDANMYWASRMLEAGRKMTFVRHEHAAVAAAAAYTRASGRLAVATVTCGPGVTQLATALPMAVRARIPMIVFAGEAPVGKSYYNQKIDQGPIVAATGAAYIPMHSAEAMPLMIRDAFVQARRERRPVVIGVPMDLQALPWTGADRLPAPSHEVAVAVSPIPPHPDDLARAAALIGGADRVVVMAGLGAVEAGAGPACRALAEACGGLLAESLPARGLFRDDPFEIGIAGGFCRPGARPLFAEAELIVAVGCSLASHNADGGKLWPAAKVLQVDIDPVAIRDGRHAAEAHLRADARLGAEALAATVTPRAPGWRTEGVAEILRDLRRPADYPAGPAPEGHDPRHVAAALDRLLPAEWHLLNSSGHVSGFAAQMLQHPQDRFLTIREFGAIGNGTSFALGLAAAFPERVIVLIDGDGSFLMHVQELETMRRHGMRVLSLVLNDGAYGSEIHKLRAHGMTDEGAVFGRPDFAAVARGFGIEGATVEDLGDLPAMIAAFAKGSGPAVWNIPISDKVASDRMQAVVREPH